MTEVQAGSSSPHLDKDAVILLNLSGRGDKDLDTMMKANEPETF